LSNGGGEVDVPLFAGFAFDELNCAEFAGETTAFLEAIGAGNCELRRFPIDPAKLWGRRADDIEYIITLPAGWHADLPKSVSTASPFGIYQSEYTQKGNVLRLVRHIEGTTGVRPPEAVTELVAWFRAVAADDAKQIVLMKDKT